MIINQPDITQNKIAEKMKITNITANRNINKLKELEIIERIGSNKKGYWKIINK